MDGWGGLCMCLYVRLGAGMLPVYLYAVKGEDGKIVTMGETRQQFPSVLWEFS
jgi:hypothetical protein